MIQLEVWFIKLQDGHQRLERLPTESELEEFCRSENDFTPSTPNSARSSRSRTSSDRQRRLRRRRTETKGPTSKVRVSTTAVSDPSPTASILDKLFENDYDGRSSSQQAAPSGGSGGGVLTPRNRQEVAATTTGPPSSKLLSSPKNPTKLLSSSNNSTKLSSKRKRLSGGQLADITSPTRSQKRANSQLYVPLMECNQHKNLYYVWAVVRKHYAHCFKALFKGTFREY